MRILFLAKPSFSPDSNPGFGGGGVEDLYGDDDEQPQGNAPEEGPLGTPAPIVAPGPALGPDGANVEVPIEKVTGTPAPEGTEKPQGENVQNLLGTFSDLNDFATRAFGVKDGLIQFEGEEGPGHKFTDLPADDQKAITEQWLAQLPNEQEKKVLAELRAAGGVDNFVRQRAEQFQSQDFTTLSDDDVHRQDIRDRFGDISDQEVEAELAHRKSSTLYERQTNDLRTGMQNKQQQEEVKLQQAENQRIVDSFRDISNVAGILLKDEHKNEVLGDLLTPDPSDPTVSKFVKKFDDPKFLIRMATLDRYADFVIQQLSAGRIPVKKDEQPAPTGGFRRAGGREVDDLLSE